MGSRVIPGGAVHAGVGEAPACLGRPISTVRAEDEDAELGPPSRTVCPVMWVTSWAAAAAPLAPSDPWPDSPS